MGVRHLPAQFAAIATVSIAVGITGLFMDSPAERGSALVVGLVLALSVVVMAPIAERMRRLERRDGRRRILAGLRELRRSRGSAKDRSRS